MRILIRLFMLSLLVILSAAGVSQNEPATESWFSVAISPPGSPVNLGSDAKLKVVFTNNTGKNLYFSAGGPGRSGPVFDIDLRDGEGNPVQETAYGVTMHGKDPRPFSGSVFRATAAPGQTLEETVLLNKEFEITKPGKYTVQVRGKTPNGRFVRSNTVAISIVP
jgi:hypothetical protein